MDECAWLHTSAPHLHNARAPTNTQMIICVNIYVNVRGTNLHNAWVRKNAGQRGAQLLPQHQRIHNVVCGAGGQLHEAREALEGPERGGGGGVRVGGCMGMGAVHWGARGGKGGRGEAVAWRGEHLRCQCAQCARVRLCCWHHNTLNPLSPPASAVRNLHTAPYGALPDISTGHPHMWSLPNQNSDILGTNTNAAPRTCGCGAPGQWPRAARPAAPAPWPPVPGGCPPTRGACPRGACGTQGVAQGRVWKCAMPAVDRGEEAPRSPGACTGKGGASAGACVCVRVHGAEPPAPQHVIQRRGALRTRAGGHTWGAQGGLVSYHS